MKITVLDLFSGIGGFHLGLKGAGFEVESYFSEVDKYAIQVYQNNFKEAKYVGSVTDVRGTDLPKINAITFGSPCQDFSLAGKRKGMEGNRSSLITHAIRLIDECRPDFFIWENVKGTFSSNNGEDFWAIIQAFTNIGGYRLEWQLLNTKWFLPQNRERIYLVGYLADGSGGQVFPIGEGIGKDDDKMIIVADTNKGGERGAIYDVDGIMSCLSATDYKQPKQIKVNSSTKEVIQISDRLDSGGKQPYQQDRIYDSEGIAPALMKGKSDLIVKVNSATSKGYEEATDGDSINLSVPTSKTRRGRVGKGIAQTLDTHCNQVVIQNKIRRLTPVECERLQGFPDNWTKFGTQGEISDSQRYKMCGNAVTVNVVKAVAEQIKKVL